MRAAVGAICGADLISKGLHYVLGLQTHDSKFYPEVKIS